MKTYTKVSFIVLLIFCSGIQYNDFQSNSSFENISNQMNEHSENRGSGEFPSDSSLIELNEEGDSFENATLIQYGQTTLFELNSTYSNLYFRFTGTKDTFINITMKQIAGDQNNLNDPGFRLHDQYFNRIATADSYEVFEEELLLYRLTNTGTYYIRARADGGVISTFRQFELNFVLHPTNNQDSKVREKVLNSLSNQRQEKITDYFIDTGAINLTSGTVNIEAIKAFDPLNYVKTSSIIIQGLLVKVRTSESVIPKANEYLEHGKTLNASINLLATINNTRLNNGLYVNSTDIDPNDPLYPGSGFSVSSFSENVYALAANVEILRHVFLTSEFGISLTPSFYNAIFRDMNETIDSIISTFRNTTNFMYREYATFDIAETGGVSTNLIYTDSNSYFGVLLRSFSGLYRGFYNITEDPSITDQNLIDRRDELISFRDQLSNSILNTLFQNNIPYDQDIKAPGLGVEYWDEDSGLLSNTSTLLANAYLIQLLRPSFFGYNGLATEGVTNVTSNIIYNTLKLFKRDGVLISNILLNESYQGFESYLYENAFFVEVLREVYTWYDLLSDPEGILKDEGRSWARAANNLRINIDELFFDNVFEIYYPMYDHFVDLSFRDDNSIETNLLVGNLAYYIDLALRFDFKATTVVPNTIEVYQENEMFLRLESNVEVYPYTFQTRALGVDVGLNIVLTDSTQNSFTLFDVPNVILDTDGSISFEIPFLTEKRGLFTISIQFTYEGQIMLSEELTSVAIGVAFFEELSTTERVIYSADKDEEFETEFRMVDQGGEPVSGLQLNSYWIYENQVIDLPQYKNTILTASDGIVTINTDLSTVIEDIGLGSGFDNINHVTLFLALNSSNIEELDLKLPGPYLILPVDYIKSITIVDFSPRFLEIEQGTSEDETMTFSVSNQFGDAISDASVKLNDQDGNELGSDTTTSTGSAEILLEADDLAILTPGEGLHFTLYVNHSQYSLQIFEIPYFVKGNSLHLATDGDNSYTTEVSPFSGRLDEKYIPETFQSDDPNDIIFRITGGDEFGKSVTADLSLKWDENFKVGYQLSDDALTTAAGANSITIDTSQLEVGEYRLIIEGTKLGLASTENPATYQINISVVRGSIVNSLFAAIFILLGFLLSWVIGWTKEKILLKMGRLKECQNCHSSTSSKNNACHSCGNLMPGKKLIGISAPEAPSNITKEDIQRESSEM